VSDDAVAEILVDGLRDLDGRAEAAAALISIYRTLRLPDWVEGAVKRLARTRRDREEVALGNVQRAFQAFLEGKGVHQVNRLRAVVSGDKVCYVTKTAVCHIRGGCGHGK
jgi:hypothetical protein